MAALVEVEGLSKRFGRVRAVNQISFSVAEGEVFGFLGPVDEKQITELLGTVGMTERANDKVKRYSMGMRQRLALAQAMLGRPRLLILDEPTNGLDPNGIHGLRILLRKLATDEGLTIF